MTTKKTQVELPDLYFKMGEIDAKMDTLILMVGKVIYAVLALAGATVGLKLMGTPPLLVVSSFISGFVFFFAVILSVFNLQRRQIKYWQFILLWGLAGVTGNIHKVIWPADVSLRTCLFTAGHLCMIMFLWKSDNWGYEG